MKLDSFHFNVDFGYRLLVFTIATFVVTHCILPSWLLSCGCATTLFFTILSIGVPLITLIEHMIVDPNGKAVVITGCDTGFGHDLAIKLHEKGFIVFAGCLFPSGEGGSKLSQIKSNRFHVIHTDVTSETSLAEAADYVKKHLPSGVTGLWALVNNAGIASLGAVEWTPIQEYQRVLDVNLFGPIRSTKAFLPLVRKCKGRVITVTSVLGQLSLKHMTAYVSSKWGLEGFMDCLRAEMKHFGVQAIVMEPGNYIGATAILTINKRNATDEMWNGLTDEVKSAYTRQFFDNEFEGFQKGFVKYGRTDRSPAVSTLVLAVSHVYPQKRYQSVTWSEKLNLWKCSHLPDSLEAKAITR